MDGAAEPGLTVASGLTKVQLEAQTDPTAAASSQASVIQSPQPVVHFSKNNVIIVSKAGSVIQTTPATNVQSLQVIDTATLPSPAQFDEEQAARQRREILSRRASYRKILNDLGGGEISEDKVDPDAEAAAFPGNGIIKVIPAGQIQISSADGVQGLQTLSMSGGTATASNGAGTLVQYTQGDGQYYVPVSIPVTGSLKLDGGGGQHMVLTPGGTGEMAEEVTKKREVRLYKNREAARECRRKKKEYIKCLENRVAVLENQNKALIEELKSLKELYCQKKLP